MCVGADLVRAGQMQTIGDGCRSRGTELRRLEMRVDTLRPFCYSTRFAVRAEMYSGVFPARPERIRKQFQPKRATPARHARTRSSIKSGANLITPIAVAA